MNKKISKESINLRFNIVSLIVYVIGIILIMQLFNLQIVNGSTYRQQSDTRLTRESSLTAARGSILDRSGNALASTKMGFSLEFYKTKISTQALNETILNLINLLEKYNLKYPDSFPVNINPFQFTIEGETLENWKSKNKLNAEITPEEALYAFKEKYDIENTDIQEIRKIIAIRYEISQKGYSSTKSLNICTDIPREAVAELTERSSEFPGVNIVTESIRTYNSGTLASHILGYIGRISEKEYEEKKDTYNNDDIIGKTGVEYLFEKYLKGKDGIKQIDMAVDGTVTAEYVATQAISGSDIVLTIDSNLQKVAEESLKNTIQKISSGGFAETYEATAGSVVVMDVKTGEVLSLASYPDYSPEDFVGGISTDKYNEYSQNHSLYNRAISGSYAPGSIFKMVSAIAGLESGAITLTEKINDTGVYPKYTRPVCWYYTDYRRGHGYLNVSQAIQHSCNFFFYEVGDRMGIDTLSKYASYFGLGTKTGIELPSETAGTLASKQTKAEKTGEQWYPGETTSAVIGQSYNSFSTLQMTKYISMLTNGGKRINPTIIKTIRNVDGTEVPKDEIRKYSNEMLGIQEYSGEEFQIKQENLQAVLEGMRMTTQQSGGTAYSIFRNFNIEVAGKTGSAEAPGNIVNAWFACFAPYNEPEIAVVVMIENGGHGNYSAEVARDIIAEYFGMNAQNIEEDMTAIPYTEIIQ